MERLRQTPAYREAVAELTGVSISEGASEASLLSALLAAGRQAVTEKVEESGYAAWAASMDDDDKAFRTAMRQRVRGGSE